MRPKKNIKGIRSGIILMMAALFFSFQGFAAGPPKQSVMENSLALTLVIIAVVLLLAIGMLAYVVMGAAEVYYEKIKNKKASSSTAEKVLMVLGLLIFSPMVFAQDAAEASQENVVTSIGGLSASTFYILIGVVGLEIIVMLILVNFLRIFIMKEKVVVAEAAKIKKPAFWLTWWNKMNSLRPIQEEEDIMLDHNYDGIRELDNKLPPWWLYGFYLTIFVSVIYMYRYHVAHSAPLPHQELAIAMEKADAEKEEFLKNSKNNVDENTVTLISDETELAEGKGLFISQCAACHSPDGGGLVGPNLTDEYWLHKGGVKDIFKVIKYGVPEKGMKSWKDDFSPVQIARITGFIKTLKGTKPATPKEPQGDLYTEEQATPDSTNANTEKGITDKK